MGRWVPFLKASEGADVSSGFEVKRHMIFSSTYKVNMRVEVVTYRVLGVFENYYNKWNIQIKEESNIFNRKFWNQGGINKVKVKVSAKLIYYYA